MSLRSLLDEEQSRYDHLSSQLSELKSQSSSSLNSLLNDANESRQALLVVKNTINGLRSRITALVTSNDSVYSQLQLKLSLVTDLKEASNALQALITIQQSSQAVRDYLKADDVAMAIESYKTLYALRIDNVRSSQVEAFLPPPYQLQVRLRNELFSLLKTRLSNSMDPILLELGWPKTLHLNKVAQWNTLLEVMKEASKLMDPDASKNGGLAPWKQTPHLLVQLLVEPIKVAFTFHFQGSRPTNNLAKPEYYLRYILRILSQHSAFIETVVQPLLDQYGTSTNANDQFVHTLADLVTAKLTRDLPKLLQQPSILVHTINEVLAFDQQLITNHLVVTDFVDETRKDEVGDKKYIQWRRCIHALIGNKSCFLEWVQVERRAALSQLESIITDPKRWEPVFEDSSDLLKTCESVERVKTLFELIRDLFAKLQTPIHQLTFVMDVQIPLLSQYAEAIERDIHQSRSSFVPIGDAKYSIAHRIARVEKLAKCANAAYNITLAIKKWWDESIYLVLSKELESISEEHDPKPVFHNILQEYESLYTNLTEIIVEGAWKDFLESLWAYHKQTSWIEPASQVLGASAISTELSESAHVLKYYLETTHSCFSARLFKSNVLRKLCSLVDEHIWSNIVVKKTFSVHGGMQFYVDVHGLTQVIQPFHNSAKSLLPKLVEASNILRLPKDSNDKSFSIYEIMDATLDEEKLQDMMKSLDIFLLSSKDVKEVICQRIEANES